MVKVLNRDKIQRMVDYTGGAGTQSGSGGGGEGVNQSWVNANFVSIAYFEQLFKAYKPAEQSGDPDVEVKPNTIDEDISNIKAMKGFWTEQFISALGQGSGGGGGGGGGGGASALGDLVDVTISSPSSGQVLMYDGNGHWINGSISMSGYATQAWVQQQGYLPATTAASTYLPLTGGTLTGLLFFSQEGLGTTYIGHANANWMHFESPVPFYFSNSVSVNGDIIQYSTGYSWIHSGNIESQNVNSAKYLTTYAANGNSNLECLQNAFSSVPKSVGTAIRLQHGSHSMAFGWFLSGYDYANAYGGWFISDYGAPSWVGVDNGTWNTQSFITSANIGSQSVNYASSAGNAGTLGGTALNGLFTDLSNTSDSKISMTIGGVAKTLTVGYALNAGNADTVDGYHSYGLLTRFSMGDPQSSEDSSKLYLGIGGATPTPITVGYASSAYSSTYADYADRLIYTRKIWGQNFNGSGDVTGNLTLGANNYLFLTGSSYSSGSYIIGRSGGIAIAVGGSSYENFAFYQSKFYANAEIEAETGVYSHGYVTALSDVRLKKIIDRFTLKPEAIALASLIHYTWKKGHDDSVHVGGIAQEWQEILPEAVHDIDGRLTMDYGVIGMVSAVSLAKTVIEQEKRIKSLEERLAAIEEKLK